MASRLRKNGVTSGLGARFSLSQACAVRRSRRVFRVSGARRIRQRCAGGILVQPCLLAQPTPEPEPSEAPLPDPLANVGGERLVAGDDGSAPFA